MNKESFLNKWYTFFVYCIAFILILNCQSVWMTVPGLSSKLNTYLFFVIVLLITLVIGILVCNNNELNVKSLINFLALFSTFVIVYITLTNKNILFCLKIFLLVVLFYTLMMFDNGEITLYLLKAYKNLMVIIVVISLFFWIFGSILKIIPPTGLLASNWGNFTANNLYFTNYHNLYFETQYITVPVLGSICRNTAIFPEAPMASLNFSLAFLIEKTMEKRINKKNTLILFMGILTTFSTTGYILLISYFIIKSFLNNKYDFKLKLFILIPLIFVGTIIFLFMLDQKTKYGNMSMAVRVDDYLVGLKTWLIHPFLGNGIADQASLKANMESWRIVNPGFSNSITEILAEGGIYLTNLYLFCFGKGIYNSIHKKSINLFLLTFGIFYLFVFTIFTYNYILFIFLLLFLYSNKLKLN